MKVKEEVGGNGVKPEQNRMQTHGHLSRGLFDSIGRKRIYDKENDAYVPSVMRTQSTVKVEYRYAWSPKTYLLLV